MKSIYVKINGISDVSNFASMASRVNGDVIVKKGIYVVAYDRMITNSDLVDFYITFVIDFLY